ncbi:MAG: VTC domain-containing protein, partial [Bacteroidota bacterium]
MLRYEYKYYVPNEQLDVLRNMIHPFVQLDQFAASRKRKEYTVRSIYFETPDFECYRTKVAGLKHRNKVRLRGY